MNSKKRDRGRGREEGGGGKATEGEGAVTENRYTIKDQFCTGCFFLILSFFIYLSE